MSRLKKLFPPKRKDFRKLRIVLLQTSKEYKELSEEEKEKRIAIIMREEDEKDREFDKNEELMALRRNARIKAENEKYDEQTKGLSEEEIWQFQEEERMEKEIDADAEAYIDELRSESDWVDE